MTFRVLPVETTGAQRWLDGTKAGELVSVLNRNSFVAATGLSLDTLARPEVILRGSDPAANLPRIPHRGTDRTVTEVPVVGGLPLPAWWSASGAGRPEDLPADLPEWLRGSNLMRWQLYGALRALLDELARTGNVAQAGQSSPRTTGDLSWANVALCAVAPPIGLAAYAIGEREESRRVQMREEQNTARFAEQCNMVLKLYQERLQVFRDTGRMPEASTAEQTANPIVPTGQPNAGRAAPGSVSERGESWWSSTPGTLAVGAGAGAGLVAAGYGGVKLYQHAQRKAREAVAVAAAVDPRVAAVKGLIGPEPAESATR